MIFFGPMEIQRNVRKVYCMEHFGALSGNGCGSGYYTGIPGSDGVRSSYVLRVIDSSGRGLYFGGHDGDAWGTGRIGMSELTEGYKCGR